MTRKRRHPTLFLLVLLLIPLALAGCGAGGDETTSTVALTSGSTETVTTPSATTASTEPEVTTITGAVESSSTEPETTTTTEQLSSAETALPDGRIKALGYIDKVWGEGGKRYLSIDYAEFLTGRAAVDAAAAAGHTMEPGEDQYWIRNDNPQKRTFSVSDSVAITTSTRWRGPGGQLGPADEQIGASCTWADFTTFWGTGTLPESEQGLHEKPWWIEREGPVVVKIDEQYLP